MQMVDPQYILAQRRLQGMNLAPGTTTTTTAHLSVTDVMHQGANVPASLGNLTLKLPV